MFSTAAYHSPPQKDRARILYGLVIILLILVTASGIFVTTPQWGGTPLSYALQNPVLLVGVAIFYALALSVIVLTRLGRVEAASISLIIITTMVCLVTGLQNGFNGPASVLTVILLLLVSAFALQERGLIVATLLAELMVFWGVSNRQNNPLLSAEIIARSGSDLSVLMGGIIGAAIMIGLYVRNTRIDRLYTLAQTADERLKLSALLSRLTQRITRRNDLTSVLNTSVEEIIETYPNVYHAQIFLIDDKSREARLAASTGEVGALLLRRGHSLAVGSRSVIGQVTVLGRAVIAPADSQDSVHKRNEFLPETTVEAAFPLRLGDTIIGALDLQSRNPNAFQDDDVPLFQSLADSIAVAIDNARLFEQTEQRLRENQTLLQQMGSTMRQVERLNQQLTERAWSRYLAGRGGRLTLEMEVETRETRPFGILTPALAEVMRTSNVVQRVESGVSKVAVPLTIRGQTIGAIELEVPTEMSPKDITLIQEVCERLALAAEGVRVTDENRRVAQREAVLNEISRRLQTSNNVENLLTEAARSLQDTLGAERIAIRLGAPPREKEAAP